MKPMSFKVLAPVTIIVAGILIFFVLKAAQPTSKPVSIKERVWLVKTIPAKLEQLTPSLTLYGQIETPDLVNAAAPKNSRVISVSVREGDAITSGQLLLNLDPRDYEPRVAQEEAKVTELKALITSEKLRHQADQKAYRHEQSLLNLELAAVKRAEMLKNKKLGSTAAHELAQEELERQRLDVTSRKLMLDDHQARLQQLSARLAYSEAELELAQLDLERSKIIAPFNGFIDKVHVTAGNQVKENEVLVTFYPLEKLEVRAKIPAAFRNEIQRTLLDGIPLTATAIIADIPVMLELDRVSGSADARGIDALFNITQGNNLVRLGSTLSLAMQRPARKDVIAIPFSALYDNNRIYKLSNGRIEGVKVDRQGEYVDSAGRIKLLISSPKIQPGDPIVITHLPNAVNGLRVEADINPDPPLK